MVFQPPHPATWFRSFPTLADGIAHHFDFLRNRRYRAAWSAVESGNPAAFSHLLKVAGYYNADEKKYTDILVYYLNRFMNYILY